MAGMRPFHAFRIRVNKLFAPARSARIARRYRALGGGPATILSNNCAAGRMLHDLGLRLDTPTVNLWMTVGDFLDFAEGIPDSLAGNLEEIRSSGENNPVADLRFDSRSVRLHFLHDNSFEAAKAAWKRRRGRVDLSRTFLVATDNSDATAEALDRFLRLPWPKRMFVKDTWKAERLGEAGILVRGDFRDGFNVHDFPGWFGRTHYQNAFDFAAWISGSTPTRDKVVQGHVHFRDAEPHNGECQWNPGCHGRRTNCISGRGVPPAFREVPDLETRADPRAIISAWTK